MYTISNRKSLAYSHPPTLSQRVTPPAAPCGHTNGEVQLDNDVGQHFSNGVKVKFIYLRCWVNGAWLGWSLSFHGFRLWLGSTHSIRDCFGCLAFQWVFGRTMQIICTQKHKQCERERESE